MKNIRRVHILAFILAIVILVVYFFAARPFNSQQEFLEQMPQQPSSVQQTIHESSASDIVQKDEIISKPPFEVYSEMNRIIIKFPNGKTEHLVNCSKCEAPVRFKVDAIYDDPASLIVSYVSYFEDFSVRLYLPTGESLNIEDYPHFSPSKNRFAVINYSDAFSFDGWAIWQKIGDSYEKLDTSVDNNYPDRREGYYFISWEDESNVLVKAEIFLDGKSYCAPGKLTQVDPNISRQWIMRIFDDQKQDASCSDFQFKE